jgi:hypothetical protein
MPGYPFETKGYLFGSGKFGWVALAGRGSICRAFTGY